LPEIRDVGDEQVLARACACLCDGRREPDGAMMRDDDAIDARAFRGSQEDSEVLRILQRVDDKNECRIRERIEMEQELVELDARLAFDDRDDTLMVLDRREPRDLHFVGEANKDAALLRLGDEIVHRTGAHVAVLRHIEPPDVAARAYGLEDRMGTRDRLAHRLV
jgi:hypothetical protein